MEKLKPLIKQVALGATLLVFLTSFPMTTYSMMGESGEGKGNENDSMQIDEIAPESPPWIVIKNGTDLHQYLCSPPRNTRVKIGKYRINDEELSQLVKANPLITHLDLSDTPITDISCLKDLTNLKMLSLIRCTNITDFSGLEDLHNLTELYLGYTQITDSDLRHLPQSITTLNLCGTRITDISSLKNLNNLNILNLVGCTSIINFSSLKNLHNLMELSLMGCDNITNSDIQGLPKSITILKLSSCVHITDVSGLGDLINLRELYLEGCTKIKSISSLQSLLNLTHLNLHDVLRLSANITADDLQYLPQSLTYLNLADAIIPNFSIFERFPDLQTLVLSTGKELKGRKCWENILDSVSGRIKC